MTTDLKQSFLYGAFLMFAGVTGCSVTATTNGSPTNTCSADANVSGCSGGAAGYSCTGSDSPDENIAGLSCSSGIFGNNRVLLYCCVSAGFTANTCAQDSTVTGCITPSIGFSCAGTSPPEQFDTSLVCSSGVASGGATAYCCNAGGSAPVTTACGVDANVSCVSGGTGYTCPGSMTPEAADPSLNCGTGVTESNGETGYCCNTGATPTACTVDPNVSCTGTTGYSCPSGVSPEASNTALTCGAGITESNGEMGYCCTTATTTSTCSPNTAVSCIAAGTTGYSCTGTDTPWQATPSLICETTVVNGATGYCCVTSANSCAQAPAITDCVSGAFGVTCSGTDTTTNSSASLVCSGDPSGDPSNFCCTTN